MVDIRSIYDRYMIRPSSSRCGARSRGSERTWPSPRWARRSRRSATRSSRCGSTRCVCCLLSAARAAFRAAFLIKGSVDRPPARAHMLLAPQDAANTRCARAVPSAECCSIRSGAARRGRHAARAPSPPRIASGPLSSVPAPHPRPARSCSAARPPPPPPPSPQSHLALPWRRACVGLPHPPQVACR